MYIVTPGNPHAAFEHTNNRTLDDIRFKRPYYYTNNTNYESPCTQVSRTIKPNVITSCRRVRATLPSSLSSTQLFASSLSVQQHIIIHNSRSPDSLSHVPMTCVRPLSACNGPHDRAHR